MACGQRKYRPRNLSLILLFMFLSAHPASGGAVSQDAAPPRGPSKPTPVMVQDFEKALRDRTSGWSISPTRTRRSSCRTCTRMTEDSA